MTITSKRRVRERLGWERRCLQEMSEHGSVIYCFPGYMGSHCERLVAKGLATRETLGPKAMPEGWPHGAKDWKSRAGIEHRYTITEAGRALLPDAA